MAGASANETSKDANESALVFDRSIDMSLMDDEKNTSEFRRLRTIQEVEEEKKCQEERQPLMDSQQSATFPDVPVKLLANERAQSDVMEKHEFDRK